MGARLLEIGVVIVTALSAGLLALLLAAPLMPQPSGFPPLPSVSPGPSDSGVPEPDLPPMGLFLMRNAFSFGACLAIELEPRSYPVAEGTEGSATVLWWQRGMTGCDGRTGEVESLEARTHVVPDSTDPSAPPVGYTLEFSLPLFDNLGPIADDAPVDVSLTILTRQSTDTVLQAIEEAPGSGQGYVLDRVPAVDPPLNPLPTPVPAAGGPIGLYLLRGPFTSEGPCLVIELGELSYPGDPPATGSATVRWWEPGRNDPTDPTVCLGRNGPVSEGTASLVRFTDESDTTTGFNVAFEVTTPSRDAELSIELFILLAESTEDLIVALVLTPDGVAPVSLDRVDEIDPPLVPVPSSSPGP